MMTCRYCKQELPENAVFCPYCGKKVIPPEVYCEKCGTKLSSEYNFCMVCGTPTGLNVSRPSDDTVPEPQPRPQPEPQPEPQPQPQPRPAAAAFNHRITVTLRTGSGITVFNQCSGSLVVTPSTVSFAPMIGSGHAHSYNTCDIRSTEFGWTNIGVTPQPSYKVTMKSGQVHTYVYSPLIKGQLQIADQDLKRVLKP